jgi:hypothetical protein
MHRSRLLSFALGALLLAPAACGGGGGGDGSGSATLEVRMQDTPVDEADSVFVTIDRVEVMRPGSAGEVTEVLVSTPAQYDLLVLQNGVSAVLGTGRFPPGEYSSIRLIVGTNTPEEIDTLPADQLKNHVVIDGVSYPLVVPSGAQTGIKLNHRFTLTEDEITVLTLDFDVRKSVHRRGHQDVFNLRPTIRLVDTVVSGTVSGTVTTSDASPVPVGTVVSAQQAGVEVGSATVAADGTYSIGPLLAGTYDLVATAPGYGVEALTGVEVVAQQDAAGNDFVLEPSATGDVAGTVTFGASDPATVLVRLTWNGFLVATTAPDPSTGGYGFEGVPVGDYVVVATDGTASASGPATVTSGTETIVDLVLP